jgi:hypothetical protein
MRTYIKKITKQGGNAMTTELYEEMDPDYTSRIFMARKALLGSLESPTLLPDYGLKARSLLNEEQWTRMQEIRNRKNSELLGTFIPD